MGYAHEHTVSTFILRLPAEAAREAGIDVDGILERHGIPPKTLDEFGSRALAQPALEAWTEIAAATGDPEFGLRLATRAVIGSYDVLGYIVRSSPDLEHGFEQLIRYQRLLGDAWRFDIRMEDSIAILSHEFLVPLNDPRQLVEHHFALLALRAQQFTRPDWRPSSVGFRHSAPENVELHHQILGDDVRFGQLTNSMRVDRAALAESLNMTDSLLARVLERYAEQALRRMPPPGDYAARVRLALVDLLTEGDCSAQAVAKKLNTSSRSLQRYLAEEGTTLRQLIDSVRRELAEEYLGDSRMTFEEIAMLLAFSDASGFTHAFRRWTGRTPNEFRRDRSHYGVRATH